MDNKAMALALSKIQKELKAPKGQFNKFGNYNYRSCEDITNAVKPLLPEGVSLILQDELVLIGERYYIKATAMLTDGESCIEASAYARESLTKKGMDDSQITGSTSSYARKYALNGLFAIDDTKDADSMDNSDHGQKPTGKQPPKKKDQTQEMIQEIDALLKASPPEKREEMKTKYGFKSPKDLQNLTLGKMVDLIKDLKNKPIQSNQPTLEEIKNMIPEEFGQL